MAAEQDRAALEANVALQQRVGIRTQVVSSCELRDLLLGAEIGDVAAAAYEPESGYADPHLTVSAYAKAARRLGAEFFVGTEVIGFGFAGQRVTDVQTSAGRFSAPSVVNCAGPWARRVAQWAGVTVPIRSCRAQVGVFRQPAGLEEDHPVIIDFVHAAYFRPEIGCLTLAGVVAGEPAPLFPRDMFRFSRFAENRLVRGGYRYRILG